MLPPNENRWHLALGMDSDGQQRLAEILWCNWDGKGYKWFTRLEVLRWAPMPKPPVRSWLEFAPAWWNDWALDGPEVEWHQRLPMPPSDGHYIVFASGHDSKERKPVPRCCLTSVINGRWMNALVIAAWADTQPWSDL